MWGGPPGPRPDAHVGLPHLRDQGSRADAGVRPPLWKCSLKRGGGLNCEGLLADSAMTFFSKVEDTFTVPGRGFVIVPYAPSPDLDFRLNARDSIQLRTPGGAVIDTHIVSIEMLTPGGRIAFLLPASVAISDAPKGTEIWHEEIEVTYHPISTE